MNTTTQNLILNPNTYRLAEPLIYDNMGNMQLIETQEQYVRACLHDAEEVTCIGSFEGMFQVRYKDRYGWHSAYSTGLADSVAEAWMKTYYRYESNGFTGSDNARFLSADSIKEFISEIENDSDYAEELLTQRELLAQLEEATV